MLPAAILSSSYLLFGSTYCIYRLISHSYIQYTKVRPEFIFASIGIATFGIRSCLVLTYNLLWREYPIDPLIIEEELLNQKDNQHFIDWSLYTCGISSIVYSLFIHHNCLISGTIVLTSLVLLETISWMKNNAIDYPALQSTANRFILWTNTERLSPFLATNYLTHAWIITTNLFGWIIQNNYINGANVLYSLTMGIYRPAGIFHDWSIRNSLNDYMMLAYAILMTEALCQTLIK